MNGRGHATRRRWLLALGAGLILVGATALLLPLVRTSELRRREPRSGRPYRVFQRSDHVPQTPSAVLFLLHGYATSPERMLHAYWLRELAVRRRDMILVLPEGLRDSAGNPFWNASRACCAAHAPAPADDLRYLRDVLSDLRSTHALDARRVIALGFSNGGFMAYHWACTQGAELTAVVNISGAGPGPGDPPCTPVPGLTLLSLHGDADSVVAYAGGRMDGGEHPSARASLEPFLRAGRLQGPRTSRRRLLFDTIREETWSGGGGRVALWTVEGGGHQLRAAHWLLPDIMDYLQEE